MVVNTGSLPPALTRFPSVSNARLMPAADRSDDSRVFQVEFVRRRLLQLRLPFGVQGQGVRHGLLLLLRGDGIPLQQLRGADDVLVGGDLLRLQGLGLGEAFVDGRPEWAGVEFH